MARILRFLEGLSTVDLLRLGLIALVALAAVGTSAELVFLRHWGSVTQALAWPPLAAVLVAALALVYRPSPLRVRLVRLVAAGVLGLAALGSVLHLVGNLEHGAEDERYLGRWATLSPPERLFLAATGGVGEAPTLAAGALAEMALGLLLATVRHPALAEASAERRRAPAPEPPGDPRASASSRS